jgi:hypothetical protein
MSIFVKRIFNSALLAVMAGVGAAQAGQQATFHLPFEAKWGSVVLPPGDYRLETPELSIGPHQFFVKGQEACGYIAPMSTDVDFGGERRSGKTYLRLVKVDGMFYVTKYEAGPRGITFTFKVPKPSHHVEMTSRDVLNVDIAGN